MKKETPSANREERFESNELVFAKLEGHPHWPAFITEKENSQEKIRVAFIDEFDTALLDKQFILKYSEENFIKIKKKYSKNKSKDFYKSLKIANDIYNQNIDKNSYIERRNREISSKINRKSSKYKNKSNNNFSNGCNSSSSIHTERKNSSLEKSKFNTSSLEKQQKNLYNVVNNGFTQNEKIFEDNLFHRKKNKYHNLRKKVSIQCDVLDIFRGNKRRILSKQSNNLNNNQSSSLEKSISKNNENSKNLINNITNNNNTKQSNLGVKNLKIKKNKIILSSKNIKNFRINKEENKIHNLRSQSEKNTNVTNNSISQNNYNLLKNNNYDKNKNGAKNNVKILKNKINNFKSPSNNLTSNRISSRINNRNDKNNLNLSLREESQERVKFKITRNLTMKILNLNYDINSNEDNSLIGKKRNRNSSRKFQRENTDSNQSQYVSYENESSIDLKIKKILNKNNTKLVKDNHYPNNKQNKIENNFCSNNSKIRIKKRNSCKNYKSNINKNDYTDKSNYNKLNSNNSKSNNNYESEADKKTIKVKKKLHSLKKIIENKINEKKNNFNNKITPKNGKEAENDIENVNNNKSSSLAKINSSKSIYKFIVTRDADNSFNTGNQNLQLNSNKQISKENNINTENYSININNKNHINILAPFPINLNESQLIDNSESTYSIIKVEKPNESIISKEKDKLNLFNSIEVNDIKKSKVEEFGKTIKNKITSKNTYEKDFSDDEFGLKINSSISSTSKSFIDKYKKSEEICLKRNAACDTPSRIVSNSEESFSEIYNKQTKNQFSYFTTEFKEFLYKNENVLKYIFEKNSQNELEEVIEKTLNENPIKKELSENKNNLMKNNPYNIEVAKDDFNRKNIDSKNEELDNHENKDNKKSDINKNSNKETDPFNTALLNQKNKEAEKYAEIYIDNLDLILNSNYSPNENKIIKSEEGKEIKNNVENVEFMKIDSNKTEKYNLNNVEDYRMEIDMENNYNHNIDCKETKLIDNKNNLEYKKIENNNQMLKIDKESDCTILNDLKENDFNKEENKMDIEIRNKHICSEVDFEEYNKTKKERISLEEAASQEFIRPITQQEKILSDKKIKNIEYQQKIQKRIKQSQDNYYIIQEKTFFKDFGKQIKKLSNLLKKHFNKGLLKDKQINLQEFESICINLDMINEICFVLHPFVFYGFLNFENTKYLVITFSKVDEFLNNITFDVNLSSICKQIKGEKNEILQLEKFISNIILESENYFNGDYQKLLSYLKFILLIILRKINYLLECYERCSFYQINKIKKYFYLFEFFKEINKKVFNSQYEDYLETTEVTLNEFFINVVEGKFLSNENFMLVDKIKNTGKKCLLDDQKNLRLFIEKFSKQVINIF